MNADACGRGIVFYHVSPLFLVGARVRDVFGVAGAQCGFFTRALVAFGCAAGLPSFQHLPTFCPAGLASCHLAKSSLANSRSLQAFFHLRDVSGVIGR